MPLYEYECTKCGHRFEERRKLTDPPASHCPKCRSRVRRLYQPVGIIFKGSGFHVTDYGRTGEKEEKKEKAEQPSPAGAGPRED